MADPTKAPDNPDLNNVPGKTTVDPRKRAVRGRKRTAPWVWIVGIIVVLLIIWAFFGISHQRQMGNQNIVPAPASSIR